MRRVVEHRVVDLHNNRGTLPSGYADSASGIGDSPADAIRSALELLSNRDWKVGGLIERILADNDKWAREPASAGGPTPCCFVSVYVR